MELLGNPNVPILAHVHSKHLEKEEEERSKSVSGEATNKKKVGREQGCPGMEKGNDQVQVGTKDQEIMFTGYTGANGFSLGNQLLFRLQDNLGNQCLVQMRSAALL